MQEAGIQAIRAGMDVELPAPTTYGLLADAVQKGLVDRATIDTSVRRVLEAKFKLACSRDHTLMQKESLRSSPSLKPKRPHGCWLWSQ